MPGDEADAALAAIRSQPGGEAARHSGRMTSAVAGAKVVAHVEENVKALEDLGFSQEELDAIEAILRS